MHYVSFNKKQYNFNGVGRYTILKISDGPRPLFEMQTENKVGRWPKSNSRLRRIVTHASIQKLIAFGVPGIVGFQVSYEVIYN